MEPEKFKVFSFERNGWITTAGTTSQADKAQEFTLQDALAYCKVRYDQVNGEHICVPVSAALLATIEALVNGTR